MAASEKFCLQWNEFQNNLQTSYRSVRKSEDYSDVTLACGDGQQIEAHRIILSSSSAFFRDLLKKNPHPHPLIYMRGLSSFNLGSIVDFIYHGEAEIMKDHLEMFLQLAGELGVKGMSKQAEPEVLDKVYKRQVEEIPTEPPAPNIPKSVWNSLDNSEVKRNNDNYRENNGHKETVAVQEKVREVIPRPSFPCDECGKTMGTKASLRTHKYNHINKSVVVKAETSVEESGSDADVSLGLDKTIGDDEELEAKIDALTEKRNGVWNCLHCGKTDNSRFHLRRHTETHIQGFSHSCRICGKTFTTRACLKSHIAIKHPEEKPPKPFTCDICNKSSITKEALKIHKLRNHENQPNDKIPYTGKSDNLYSEPLEDLCKQPAENLFGEQIEDLYFDESEELDN